MLLEVPYFKQDAAYSCAAASVQMLLRFFKIVTSEEALIKKLNITKDHGFDLHSLVIDEVNAQGLYCYVNKGSTLDELLFYLTKHSLPVLVNYIEPENNEGHFAVVVGNQDGHLILNDPWHGPGFSMTHDAFEKRWCDGRGLYPNWMLVASQEAFELGRQYRPV